MVVRRILTSLALVLLMAAVAMAQTTPTGTVTGKIIDPEGLVLPGVTVTVTSPALQGSRSAVSSTNGDYIIPFLPAGDYKVAFELSGFATQELAIRIQVAETATLNAQMKIGAVTETVNVSAEATQADFTNTSTVAASYRADLIDTLPVGRGIEGAVLLAPGTAGTGPNGNITFSGAMSYEGLFLLNGVVLNETLRGQSRALFIEDAIEETKTSTGTISAEYGRFAGGVANTITKSGGNTFSGSFRVNLNNDSWTGLTPYDKALTTGDPRSDQVLPTYEATLGGPILRNRLWFFTAYRYNETENGNNTRYTNIPFTTVSNDQRIEGKGTWSITSNHIVKAGYTYKNLKADDTYYSSATIMDLDSLIDNETPEKLTSLNYTGVLKPNFFIEGQYSRRQLSFVGSGSLYTDIPRGTIIFDRSRSSARWNSPTFCAVCNAPEGKLNEEKRNNQNIIAKASYYWSTQSTGAHTIVFGGDFYEDSRKNDNWQSGSGYRLYANNTIFRGSGADTVLYPVVNPGATATSSSAAYIMWNPIFNTSVGSKIRTYSGFVNDSWRYNDHFTFNLGVRFDKSNAKDQAGAEVIDDQVWSPRLAATWSPTANGAWTVNTGMARYAMSATSAMVDIGSTAGRQSTFRYVYMGPAINQNPNAANLVSAHDALTIVFDWFNANGGTKRPLRDSPTYAGVNRQVGPNVTTPSSWEYSLGVARQLGHKGSIRVDGIFRRYQDFYGEKRDTTTGRVADEGGNQYDLGLLVNTDILERDYKALQFQMQYRFTPDFQLGGNYTLSQSNGNFNGETASDGPVTGTQLSYPEYKQASWNYPIGDLSIDQRHKARLWLNYGIPLKGFGRVDIGLLENVTSGQPASRDADITMLSSYVANPGYLTPPTTVTYYFGGRGIDVSDTIVTTDLSVNYTLPFRALGPKAEFFFRFIMDNLFNADAIDGPNGTVLTNATDTTLQAFNPFTTTPVENVHYRLGPDFGNALSASAYQTPRSFYFSGGFRF
jgi:outer membrane receptor for ferrienterochelin and colicin